MRFALITVTTLLSSLSSLQAEKQFVCYWESWSRYRVTPYTGSVNSIPVHLCTHVIYAFAGLNESSWKVQSLEPYWDFNQNGFHQLVALKSKNPRLKVSFAVGGWNEGASKYSNLVSKPDRIKTFVQSVVEWTKIYGFDGFDLDWEYPADVTRGGRGQDKKNLLELLRALREALDGKLLTMAVCTNAATLRAAYDVPQIVKYVDFIHVMTYDLRGAWDNIAGNHVLLYPSSNDKGPFIAHTVAQGMKNWVDAGAPPSKLVLGLALYGKSFTLENASNNRHGDRSIGNGHQGAISQQVGTLFYFEICKRLEQGWTRVFDNETKTPYAFYGDQWVGYDDVEGVSHKVNLVKQQNYAGVMLWAIDLDDPSNACGQGSYPLSNTVLNAFQDDTDEENEIQLELRFGDPVDFSTSSNSSELGSTPSTSDEVAALPDPCTSGVQFEPHWSECSKFVQCVEKTPFEMSCPPGLLFDNANSICNWPESVDPKLPVGCLDG